VRFCSSPLYCNNYAFADIPLDISGKVAKVVDLSQETCLYARLRFSVGKTASVPGFLCDYGDIKNLAEKSKAPPSGGAFFWWKKRMKADEAA